MNIPELGVGIIYFSGFENVIESNSNLIQVIEIEPQTFWFKNRFGLDSFVFNEREMNYLKSMEQPKLFHGVGYPIGGSLPLDQKHIPYLKKMMDSLNPVWLSEHLSFNNIEINGEIYNTNFLLPPLQTAEAVNVIAKNIKNYSANFDLPFSIETGTNYLSPNSFEMEDGKFINSIAEKSDAHILLDIHNLLANQKNGRQSIKDFIRQVDPERIVQIHLAGGFYFDDYYLDAHSNVSSDEVLGIFEEVVKTLPNLKAITFEMIPEYLSFVSAEAMTKQLERMNSVWDKRGSRRQIPKPKLNKTLPTHLGEPTMAEWEDTLGRLAIGKDVVNKNFLFNTFKEDKGVGIIEKLVRKFRSSLVVASLKMSCRYLMLSQGMDGFNQVLREYWLESKPLLFASDNGLQFAKYLMNESNLAKEDPIFRDLVFYEYNVLETLIDSKERDVEISFDPYQMIESLSNGQLPENLKIDKYIITVEPDEKNQDEAVKSVFHT